MLFIKVNVLIVMCLFTSLSCGNIVEELRQRFNYVTNECVDAQNNTHPAFACSGLFIRGVSLWPDMKFAWSLKARDKERNSFSFAFIRRNETIRNFKYDAGFILYPRLMTPPHKLLPNVLCSFPYDAYTHERSDRGCGRNKFDDTRSSEPCHTQNITTVSQYIEHTNLTNVQPHLICGFKMTKETETKDFAVVLQVHALILQNQEYPYWNEHRVEGWDEYNVKSLPIQAFFYNIGSENGYQEAVKYRNEFYAESGGEIVPIVGIKFPSKANPNVEITGNEALV